MYQNLFCRGSFVLILPGNRPRLRTRHDVAWGNAGRRELSPFGKRVAPTDALRGFHARRPLTRPKARVSHGPPPPQAQAPSAQPGTSTISKLLFDIIALQSQSQSPRSAVSSTARPLPTPSLCLRACICFPPRRVVPCRALSHRVWRPVSNVSTVLNSPPTVEVAVEQVGERLR